MNKEMMNIIAYALNVYIHCKCNSDLPGREDEPMVQSADKILARAVLKEINAERFMFRFDCAEADYDKI